MCAADAHAELEISILDETPLGQPKFGKPTAHEISLRPRQVELRLGRNCPCAPHVDPNACASIAGVNRSQVQRCEPINSSHTNQKQSRVFNSH